MMMNRLIGRFRLAVAGVMMFYALPLLSQPKTLTILHTNDMHAAFLPHEASWVRSDVKPLVGGFEELWWNVDSLRKAKGATILLDAGDVMTGTPISEISYRGADGGALFAMMNALGYSAWTIGNHDLDISQDNLRTLTAIASFPTVSANLVDTAGRFPFNNKGYVILDANGLRIGIIGIMSPDLFRLTNTNNLKGLKVLSPVEVTQNVIDRIDPETDLIIALTHEGVDEDSILAMRTRGLDVIIGGHSHTRLTKPKYVNNVIICQTGSSCENLGELDVTVDSDRVVSSSGTLIQLWARQRPGKSPLADDIEKFKSLIDKEYGEVIGTLTADWKRGRGETSIGNFVADAMRDAASADLAVTNNTGIRKDLLKGPVTKLDIFEVSPFRNMLATFPVTGKEVRAFAQWCAQSLARNSGSVQTSGLSCAWSRAGGSVDILSLKIAGKDVDDAKTYTCATSDFVVNQGDKYLGVVPAAASVLDITMFQSIVSKVRRDGTLVGDDAPRFKEIH